jgi:hypothetical protein
MSIDKSEVTKIVAGNTALEANGHCPFSFGLSDEDWMSLLHSELGRRWPWLSFGSLVVT